MCKNPAMPRSDPHRVVVLAIAPVIGYDLDHPAAGARRGVRRATATRSTTSRSCRSTAVRWQATRGYAIAPSAGAEALATAADRDRPGHRRSPVRGATAPCPTTCARRSRPCPADARWVSICTGAFVLAAAGILDGHRATTHWKYADDFRRLYPAAAVDEDVLFTDDGHVLTSAGLSAGIDLCLHLVRRDHGTAVANAVARHMVVPPWRDGGQAQFIERHVPRRTDEATSDVRAWAQAHLHQPLDVTTLARPGVDERAHLHPPLPRGDRPVPRRLGHPAADPPRPAPARGHRPARRPGRDPGRDGHRRVAAPAPPGERRRLAVGVPAHVPRRRVDDCLADPVVPRGSYA